MNSGNFLRWTPHGSIENTNDSSTTITGSCHQLDIYLKGKLRKSLAIDAGMYNGGHEVEMKNNQTAPQGVIDADAMFITHTHNDHVGRLPKFIADGYSGDIVLSSDAYGVIEPIFDDSLNLISREHDASMRKRKSMGKRLNQYLSQNNQKQLERFAIRQNSDIGNYLDKTYPKYPLYTQEDVAQTLTQLRPLGYSTKRFNEGLEILSDKQALVKMRLLDASHIFGSAMGLIALKRAKANKVFNVLRGGDMGRLDNRMHGRGPSMSDIVKPLDLLFMEATYGGRNHSNVQQDIQKLYDGVSSVFSQGGPVVCPTFSQSRFQDMLLLLVEGIENGKIPKNAEIIADSKLAQNVLKGMMVRRPHTYQSIINHPNIKWIKNPEDTKNLLESSYNKNRVFVLSGGMIQGGTIMKVVHYFNKQKPVKGQERIAQKGSVILSGYTPPHTLGSKIRNDTDSYNSISVSFSSHIDHDGLIDFAVNRDGVSGVKLRKNGKVVLMHGEIGGMYKIKDSLVNEGIPEENVIVPVKNGDAIDFPI